MKKDAMITSVDAVIEIEMAVGMKEEIAVGRQGLFSQTLTSQ